MSIGLEQLLAHFGSKARSGVKGFNQKQAQGSRECRSHYEKDQRLQSNAPEPFHVTQIRNSQAEDGKDQGNNNQNERAQPDTARRVGHIPDKIFQSRGSPPKQVCRNAGGCAQGKSNQNVFGVGASGMSSAGCGGGTGRHESPLTFENQSKRAMVPDEL